MSSGKFSITNKTKGGPYGLPFELVKNIVLGKEYDLSLVFIKNNESKKLNFLYRKKNKPTNVLSFALDKKCGEIFIDTEIALKEALEKKESLKKRIGLLFIHGLFHLKGMRHGSTMEAKEKRLRARFNL